MDRGKYRLYVQSRDWRMRAEMLRQAHGGACALCGIPRFLARRWDGEDLHVDHLHYGTIGAEQPEDVQLLCCKCHRAKSFREDRRKEHLAHCYGRSARTAAEWAVLAWMALAERGRMSPWPSRRAAEQDFLYAAEGLTLAEIDACMAACLRASLWGAPALACFRQRAAKLRYAKGEEKHKAEDFREGAR